MRRYIKISIAVLLAILAGLLGRILVSYTIKLEPLSYFMEESLGEEDANDRYFCQPLLIHKPRYGSITINDVKVIDTKTMQSAKDIVVYVYDSFGERIGPGSGNYSISEFLSEYPSSKRPQKYQVISQETVLFVLTPFSNLQRNVDYKVVMEYRYMGAIKSKATVMIS